MTRRNLLSDIRHRTVLIPPRFRGERGQCSVDADAAYSDLFIATMLLNLAGDDSSGSSGRGTLTTRQRVSSFIHTTFVPLTATSAAAQLTPPPVRAALGFIHLSHPPARPRPATQLLYIQSRPGVSHVIATAAADADLHGWIGIVGSRGPAARCPLR